MQGNGKSQACERRFATRHFHVCPGEVTGYSEMSLPCPRGRICWKHEHQEVTWYSVMRHGLASFYCLMVQTEIDALYNAKVRAKAELELRIQPPPQRRCLQVRGCVWIRWSEPWSPPEHQKSQQQNETQPHKGHPAEFMGEKLPSSCCLTPRTAHSGSVQKCFICAKPGCFHPQSLQMRDFETKSVKVLRWRREQALAGVAVDTSLPLQADTAFWEVTQSHC